MVLLSKMRTVAAAPSPLSNPRPFLRSALLLGALSALGAAATVPYQVALLGAGRPLPLPLPLLMLVAGAQTALLGGALAFAGLRAGERLGLGAPWVAALVEGRPRPHRSSFGLAAAVGAGGAALVAALGTYVVYPRLVPLRALPSTTWWQGLGTLLGGGFTEEILCRVGLCSLLAWLLCRWLPRRRALALAVVLASLAFGALHLPFASQLFAPSPWLFGLVAANAAVGLAFGALYVRYGLEHAIVAHVAADLLLHVALPALGAAV